VRVRGCWLAVAENAINVRLGIERKVRIGVVEEGRDSAGLSVI
jgi:hypothetical protein